MAEKYGGKVYETAEELIADPNIDAVSVCSANYSHAELTIKALRAGKHVLCEKPLASSAAQAKEKAHAEYDIFNRTQRIVSDFDKTVKGLTDREPGI